MIGIVILNYNSYEDSIALVAALQQQTVVEQLQIVVVDNASPNDSYSQLKPLGDTYNNVTVLQTGDNLGYAKGNNYGLEFLQGHNPPEYVAILNNDVVLPNDCFEQLIKSYQVLDSPAIIAPKQLDVENKEVLPYKLNSFLDDCLNLFFIFKIFHKRNALTYKDTTGLGAMKVDLIPGSFMFSSFKVFESLGFFYPNTFLFVEERFIAVKAKQKGLANYILLNETYVHAHSKTINSVYSQVSKYRLLYTGWLEFTRECRSFGAFKAALLKPLMQLSLLEMRIVYALKSLLT